MGSGDFWRKARRQHLRYRRRQFGTLVVLGLLTSVSSSGPAMVHASSRQALESAVRADLGGLAFAYATGTPELAKQLSELEGVYPVGDGSAAASAGPFEHPATLRTARDPALHLGQLVEGRFASGEGEATVSVALAEGLGLSLGDMLTVSTERGARTLQGVGFTASSEDVDDAVVVTVDPGLRPADATQWLTDRGPDKLTEPLTDSLSIRTSSVRSAASLAEQRRGEVPAGVADLRHLPIVAAGLWIALLVAAVLAFVPLLASDVDLLERAGVTRSRAWRDVTWLGAAGVLVGQAAGAGLTWVGVRAWRSELAGLVGQRWPEVPGPWVGTALLMAVTVAGFLIGPPVARRVTGLRLRATTRPGRQRLVLVVGALGAVLWVIAGFASLPRPAHSIAARAPLGLALVALALPAAVGSIAMRRLGPATGTFGRRLSRSFSVAASAAVVVACVTGSYASKGTHNANANQGRSGVLQPAGSFVAFDVPVAAAETLSREHRRLGGRESSRFLLPDERESQWRVTSVALVDCMREAGAVDPGAVDAGCFPQRAAVPVNGILLTTRGGSVTADPTLLDGGAVGMLRYRSGSGEVTDTSTLRAEPSSRLGGNLGGLVVPVARAASELGVSPSRSAAVAFWDFDSLSERSQARLRGAVTRLAPSAQTSDGERGSGYDRQRSVATAAAQVGAVVSFLVILLGGAALALGERGSLRALADMGASPRRRAGLAARVVAGPAVSLVVGLALTVPTTAVAGVQLPGSDGRWWVLPFVSGLLACLVVWRLLVRVPSRLRD